MSRGTEAGARASVLRSLRTRNSIETWPFVALVEAQTQLVLRSTALQRENSQLKSQMNAMRTQMASMRDAGGSATMTNEKIQELQAKLNEIQGERGELYKSKAADKEQILALSRELQTTKDLLAMAQKELSTLSSRLVQCEEELIVSRRQNSEMKATLDLAAAELEERRRELEPLRAALKKSEKEVVELTERILAMKEQEAERMNEIAAMYDDARSLKERTKSQATAVLESQAAAVPMEEAGGGSVLERMISQGRVSHTCRLPVAPRKIITAHSLDVHTVAHNGTGAMLLTGSEDKTVKMWDTQRGEILATYSGAVAGVMCVSFSAEGGMVSASSNDNAIRVWSTKTGRVVHTLTGHMGKIYSAKFTADSLKVVSGSYDRTLRVWDLQKGYCVKTLFCNSSCNDLCLSPDSSVIVSGHLDFNIRFWDFRTGDFAHEVSGVHSQPITSVGLVPTDGNYLLTHSRDDTLKLVDIRKYEAVRTFRSPSYRNGVHWNRATISPDGQYVAAGSADGVLHVWSLLTAKVVATLQGHRSVVEACSWGANDVLCSVDKDKRLLIWE